MGRRNSSDSDASVSRSRGGRRDSSSDRSRSRSAARGRSAGRGSDKASIKLTNDDAAFVLGSKGKTKDKIAIVSGAKVDLNDLDL